MTVKELSQLYHLNREVEQNQRRLDELRAQIGNIPSPTLSDMPRAPGENTSKVERLASEVIDLEAIVAAQQIQCIHERNRLEQYIASVDDSLTRMIFRLRFINGLSWSQVAAHIGGDTKEDTVKKTCYRYLRKH